MKRLAPGQQLVGDGGQRELVGPGVDLPGPAERLLGGHVVGGPEHAGLAGQPGGRLLDLGDAEVQHLDVVALLAVDVD